jgi:hypothetical protein
MLHFVYKDVATRNFKGYCSLAMQKAYYLRKLKLDFSRRKRANSFYSLRAYARDLGVHPATLSQVLLGNRPLPLKKGMSFAQLKLSAEWPALNHAA